MSAEAPPSDRAAVIFADAAARLRRRGATERRWASVTLWVGVGDHRLHHVRLVRGAAARLPQPERAGPARTRCSRRRGSTRSAPTRSGRDILTRVLYGGRIDLIFAVVTTIIPFFLGALVGAFAGYSGGWLDTVVNRMVDIVVAFPFIVLILAIIAITGPGLKGAYIGVFVVGWALYARLTRGEMLVEREKEYVLAAQTLGYSTWRIVFRHALPNVLRASIVFSMADIVLNILLLSALSYLGLGAAPPSPEWGALVAEGKDVILTAWWVSTLPGLVIVLVGIGFSLIGDGIADRMGKDFTLTGGENDHPAPPPRTARHCSRCATSRSASRRARRRCSRPTASASTCSAGRTLGLVGESGCGQERYLALAAGARPVSGRGPRRRDSLAGRGPVAGVQG